ncbi:MAG: GreA/GreB family elongation factor [Gemmatimonadota bacterium]|nr:GreA/GreB family elongation factor [Gemmatimonadota bacterium]
MIESLKRKLGDELEKLQHELNITLPAEIRKAVEHGDLRENSEYKAALERQQFVQARLGQLRQRLSKLSQIDVSQIPVDKIGLGSRVVVEDKKTGDVESYHLVFGDAVEFEEGQVTMSSPIGRSLVGKAVGDSVVLKLPGSTRQLKIMELLTIHEQKSEA